jgi:hypothetical protein
VEDPYLKAVLEAIASEADAGESRLITADELRAAGAFDVPAAWRKSHSARDELDDEDDEAVDDRP